MSDSRGHVRHQGPCPTSRATSDSGGHASFRSFPFQLAFLPGDAGTCQATVRCAAKKASSAARAAACTVALAWQTSASKVKNIEKQKQNKEVRQALEHAMQYNI